jgi:hypothetical protein
MEYFSTAVLAIVFILLIYTYYKYEVAIHERDCYKAIVNEYRLCSEEIEKKWSEYHGA